MKTDLFAKHILNAALCCLIYTSCTTNDSMELIEKRCMPKEFDQISSIVDKLEESENLLSEVDEGLQDSLAKTVSSILERVPAASIAILIPAEGIWEYHGGVASTLSVAEVASDQLFQVASVTKTFIATIIMQLVDDGRISLRDTLDNWYPKFPNSDRITIDQLLRHTSGLASFNAAVDFGPRYHTPEELIEMVSDMPLLFEAGNCMSYSNTGYVFLGRIIEKVEGSSLKTVLEKRIISVIGLSNTTLREYGDDVPVVSGHDFGDVVAIEDDYSTAYAAGSIASTARDLVIFWSNLLGGKIISKQRLKEMFTEVYAMDSSSSTFYGAGVQIYNIVDGPGLMIGHSGGIVGFTSIVAYLPEDDIHIAVLFNDKQVPAEAGLWSIVQTIRTSREVGRTS